MHWHLGFLLVAVQFGSAAGHAAEPTTAWPKITLPDPAQVQLKGPADTALERGIARLALPPYTTRFQDPSLLAAARRLGDFYVATTNVFCSSARETELRATGTGGDGHTCCYFPAIEGLALLYRATSDARYLDQCANGGYGWRHFDGDAAGPIGTRGTVDEWNFCCSFHGPLGLHFLKSYLATGSERGVYINFPLDFEATVKAGDRTWRVRLSTEPTDSRNRCQMNLELSRFQLIKPERGRETRLRDVALLAGPDVSFASLVPASGRPTLLAKTDPAEGLALGELPDGTGATVALSGPDAGVEEIQAALASATPVFLRPEAELRTKRRPTRPTWRLSSKPGRTPCGPTSVGTASGPSPIRCRCQRRCAVEKPTISPSSAAVHTSPCSSTARKYRRTTKRVFGPARWASARPGPLNKAGSATSRCAPSEVHAQLPQ